MPKENDLEGSQDQGGKHGGQAGTPHPQQAPKEVREGQHKSESEKNPLKGLALRFHSALVALAPERRVFGC